MGVSENRIYSFSSDSGDPTFQALLIKALSGELIAQQRLMRMYFEGNGVERDSGKAEYWAGRMREHGIALSEEEQRHIPMI